MAVLALDFGQGYGLPYTVFMPVQWAPLNQSGVGSVNSQLGGNGGGAQNFGTGITPDLLAASQANLAQIANNGLATVTFAGFNSQGLIASLFAGWGQQLQDIAQQNADSFSQSINNSAKACSGFFSCLFG